jgi:hypothetical protein
VCTQLHFNICKETGKIRQWTPVMKKYRSQ